MSTGSSATATSAGRSSCENSPAPGTTLSAAQLHRLVDAGNSVVVVEHDMEVVADADWVIDLGPGAGDRGGRIVAAGPAREVAAAGESRTAPYLARALGDEHGRAA